MSEIKVLPDQVAFPGLHALDLDSAIPLSFAVPFKHLTWLWDTCAALEEGTTHSDQFHRLREIQLKLASTGLILSKFDTAMLSAILVEESMADAAVRESPLALIRAARACAQGSLLEVAAFALDTATTNVTSAMQFSVYTEIDQQEGRDPWSSATHLSRAVCEAGDWETGLGILEQGLLPENKPRYGGIVISGAAEKICEWAVASYNPESPYAQRFLDALKSMVTILDKTPDINEEQAFAETVLALVRAYAAIDKKEIGISLLINTNRVPIQFKNDIREIGDRPCAPEIPAAHHYGYILNYVLTLHQLGLHSETLRAINAARNSMHYCASGSALNASASEAGLDVNKEVQKFVIEVLERAVLPDSFKTYGRPESPGFYRAINFLANTSDPELIHLIRSNWLLRYNIFNYTAKAVRLFTDEDMRLKNAPVLAPEVFDLCAKLQLDQVRPEILVELGVGAKYCTQDEFVSETCAVLRNYFARTPDALPPHGRYFSGLIVLGFDEWLSAAVDRMYEFSVTESNMSNDRLTPQDNLARKMSSLAALSRDCAKLGMLDKAQRFLSSALAAREAMLELSPASFLLNLGPLMSACEAYATTVIWQFEGLARKDQSCPRK